MIPLTHRRELVSLIFKMWSERLQSSSVFYSKEAFQNFKNLKCICTASTGTIHIDLSDAKTFNVDIISIKDDIKFLSFEKCAITRNSICE